MKFSIFLLLTYCFFAIIWFYSFSESSYKKNINYRIGSYGHQFSRLKDAKKVNNVDLLILGASHAYRGFDTRIFEHKNIKAFNLGSSNQTHIQTNYLLHRYLERMNPKRVFYEVYPYSLEADGVESTIDLVSNESLDRNLFLLAFQINSIRVYNSLIISLFEQLIGIKKLFKETPVKNDDIYIMNGGYVEKKIRTCNPKKQSPKKWNINPKQLEKLKENLAILRQKNIPFVLIQAPTTKAEYQSYSNNSEMDSLYQTLGEYYNFNNISKLNDKKHFYDLEHLNQKGVEIFNRDMLSEIGF